MTERLRSRPGLASDATCHDRTLWPRGGADFLRTFLGDHRSGTLVLLGAIVASLLWANVADDSYRSFWSTEIGVSAGGHGATTSLREIVDQMLMSLFFLIVGLEARREWDLGDLRDRQRSLLPLVIGLVALVVPAAIFVGINLSFTGGAPEAWGTAMSTDTAMALGGLSLISRGTSPRLRQFMITVLVADDIGSLVVIAVLYSADVRVALLVSALLVLGVYWWAQRVRLPWPALVSTGVAAWALTRASGVDPIVSGLVIGLLAPAYVPALGSLEHATRGMRSFREQPTAAAARAAIVRLRAALSPNAKLQQQLGLFVSLVILPLFAIANLGIRIDATLLRRAFTEPLTWGIVCGLLVGKPVAYVVVSWAVRRLSKERLIPPVPRGDVLTAGALAAMGFTVTVLVATRSLRGLAYEDAVIGALTALLGGPVVAVGWARLRGSLPGRVGRFLRRPGAPVLVDLVSEVDGSHDHVRGRPDAGVTIVEYGDFECPFCGRAEESLTAVLNRLPAQVRYVWRHLPLVDVHPAAWRAALASEAAGAQGAFWPMHDALLAHRAQLEELDLVDLAASLGLDTDRFVADLESSKASQKVAQDVESARLSDVAGTPTLFINGVRHEGNYGPAALLAAVEMVLQPEPVEGEPHAERTRRSSGR